MQYYCVNYMLIKDIKLDTFLSASFYSCLRLNKKKVCNFWFRIEQKGMTLRMKERAERESSTAF